MISIDEGMDRARKSLETWSEILLKRDTTNLLVAGVDPDDLDAMIETHRAIQQEAIETHLAQMRCELVEWLAGDH